MSNKYVEGNGLPKPVGKDFELQRGSKFTTSSATELNDLGTPAARWATLHVDAIIGGSDEMIISADGDENSASGSGDGSLSLNASGGIFTDDTVDMDNTLNVEGLVTMQAAATVGTTLGVTGVGTFTARSVHTSGLQSGGNIVSDTDSTDDLGTSSARWANVHHDSSVMEYAKKSSFTKTMTGAPDVVFMFDTANYKAVKIVCRMANGTDFTAKEVLVASDTDSGKLVEYGTVSTSTERDMDWSVSYASGTCSVKCTGTADDVLKGTYELIA